jgi:hypothetical protein
MGKRGAKHVAIRFSRLAKPLLPLARFPFTLPPLPQNSPHGAFNKPRQHVTAATLAVTPIHQNPHFQHLQSQSGHAGSLQHDGVLPPTRAAGRLPPRVPAGPESARRFTHTVDIPYILVDLMM